MAIYPYIVNLNGTWYPAGTVVPDSRSEKEVDKQKILGAEQETPKRRSKKNRTVKEE